MSNRVKMAFSCKKRTTIILKYVTQDVSYSRNILKSTPINANASLIYDLD